DSEKSVAETEALPKTVVRRLVKEKLSQLSRDSEISVLRDSLLAFSESARVFIHYLSATAHDICKDSRRQIINAEDVFKALEDIDFPEFIGPLRTALEDFRRKNTSKKKGATASSSKAKESASKRRKVSPSE
ncbi:hypothetical protein M569_09595, partial [Genlisea aurea]